MIVTYTDNGWEVIYQYAHGLLAGQVAYHLHSDYRPKLWLDTLTAIINHDDYVLDFSERSYVDERGAPLDFTREDPGDDERLEHIRRVITNGGRKSGWVALLISRHMEQLHRPYADRNRQLAEYLDEQHELRKGLRRRYGINLQQEKEVYRLLAFCDRLSLILCRAQVPAAGRRLEINTAMGGKTYYILQHPEHSDQLTVDPWCFGPDELRLEVEVQQLSALSFAGNKALQKALQDAGVERRSWQLSRMNSPR